MLRKGLRVRRKGEFRRIFEEGKTFAGRGLVLYVLPGKGKTRAGFTVARRVGTKVAKNRLKRRLSEAYRLVQGEVSDGYLLIFLGQEKAAHLPFTELQSSIVKLLNKAGLLAGRDER